MASNESLEGQLPAAVQSGLDQFCEKMQSALGDQIISIVLYGGFVEKDFIPENTTVKVMVVLKAVSVELLDQAAIPVQVGCREFGLAVLLLSEDELRRSTDVFPIKFLDMQRRHRLLQGQDVLSDLQIAHDHLRLRCEQEIKNLMLRLHHFYLQQAPYFERVEKTLIQGVASFVISLRVLVELKSGTTPSNNEEVLERAEMLGLDIEPVLKCLSLRRGDLELTTDELKQLYDSFMRSVHRAAELIDTI